VDLGEQHPRLYQRPDGLLWIKHFADGRARRSGTDEDRQMNDACRSNDDEMLW